MAGERAHEHDQVTPAAAGAAAAAAAHVAQLNVSRNSRVHIGPQFVSLTQTVHHDRVVKGRVLGLEVEARGGGGGGGGEGARRLRCGVAACVCWALLAAAALGAYALHAALRRRDRRLDLNISEPWYLRRDEWQALPAYETTFLELPAPLALVGHSATPPCADRYECTERALKMQREHLQLGRADVGPDFLVGGGREGLVLEGRGAGVEGAVLSGWNARAVSLVFLGDFRRGHDAPSAAALAHARALLAALVAAGALHPHYALVGSCQLAPWNYSPGVRLLRELSRMPHWDARNVSACLEWRDPADPADPADPERQPTPGAPPVDDTGTSSRRRRRR